MPEVTMQPTISSIAFGDRMLEIAYSEPTELADGAGMMRTVGINHELVKEAYDDFMDSAQQFLDAVLVAYRHARLKAE